MLSSTNVATDGTASAAIRQGDLVLAGTNFNMIVWCPTARALQTAGQVNTIADIADRTATTCYMRGLSEHIRFQTNTSVPWIWRRICFTTKDDIFTASVPGDQNPTQTYRPYFDSGTNNVGMTRNWFNLGQNNMSNTIDVFSGIIFKGTQGRDWLDSLTAPVDNSRVTVKSDVTKTIQSNNDRGIIREIKRWYPMNSNLVYNDDENGAGETTSYTSTLAKPGMGDYYIVDLFVSGAGALSSDRLTVSSTSTLYWHEK